MKDLHVRTSRNLTAFAACVVSFAWSATAFAADGPAAAPMNVLFAMDTGTRDDDHRTPAQKAAMLAELGYAGSDHTGLGSIPEALQEFDRHKLRVFGTYTGAQIGGDGARYDPGLKAAIQALKGRDAWVWLSITSRKYKPSDAGGDDEAVAVIREIADMASEQGVGVNLYPHVNFWLERIEDAVRLARKADRRNVGVTFNLYHWLRKDEIRNMRRRMEEAMPYLRAVTVNGTSHAGTIETLDRGDFDVGVFVRTLRELGYAGPIGLQGYGIKPPVAENLKRSMDAWKKLAARVTARRVQFIGPASADFAAFREGAGDWTIAGQVGLDPADDRKLAWKDGRGAAVNGPKGRTGHLFTKFEHGDCEAHVEFAVSKGSNSGVYFQGRYEVQILDSWGVKDGDLKHGDCGGIYERWKDNKGYEGRPPRVNASLPPGEWQSFDVIFRAPRFDSTGRKTANAVFVRVVHNGVTVHQNVEVTGPTRAAAFEDEKPLGPIMLQGDHGPVAYRNFWLAPMDDAR